MFRSFRSRRASIVRPSGRLERRARSVGATELSALWAMSAMSRTKRRIEAVEADLANLPQGARWREWMLRVEAAIFAATEPLPRDALARLVGSSCNLDHLLADLRDELRARPYDLVFVAGGYQLATRPRFADAIRAANAGSLRDPEPGAPFAYVTTKRFLKAFGLASLRHLPDIERLEDEGLLQRPCS